MSGNETIEQIELVLNTAGIDLIFDLGTIKGIPGFEILSTFNDMGSAYETKKQLFQFQISTKDALDYEISIDNEFTYTDNYYLYTFKIDTPLMSDTIGWSIFSANFISKEEL